jgi:hypothetical protein
MLTAADHPIAGMARYYTNPGLFTQTADVNFIIQYLNNPGNGIVWSKQPMPAGSETGSEHHGGFPEDTLTQDRLDYILKMGFDK